MQMELTIETKTETKTFRDATREQNSILARLERAALYGMAARMPSWVNSDHLSILGLVGMIGAGAFYALSKKKESGAMIQKAIAFLLGNSFPVNQTHALIATAPTMLHPKLPAIHCQLKTLQIDSHMPRFYSTWSPA